MNKKWKSLLVFFVCLIVWHSTVATAETTGANATNTTTNNTAERINGVSEFLIERANDNYFYIFEKKIKDNKPFQCYFPTTYSYVADGDLKVLVTSHEIWDDAINRDLDMLVSRVVADEIASTVQFKKIAMSIINNFIETAQFIQIEIDGKLYELTSIPLDASQKVKDTINSIYTPINNLTDTMFTLDAKLAKFSDKCKAPHIDTKQLAQYFKELDTAAQALVGWSKNIRELKDNLHIDTQKITEMCQTKPDAPICKVQDVKGKITNEWLPRIQEELDKPVNKVIAATGGAIAVSAYLNQYMENIDNAESNTQKVLEAIRVLKRFHVEDKVDLEKLKTHVLFFAQISDAKTSEEVKSLLSQYTLPPVSFFVKREKGSHHILLTSYLGYAAGKIENPAAVGEDYQHGIIAPIGLEYSYGTSHNTSVSFMVAPFDFGYPVTLKFNGVTENLKLEDVVAPAAYLTFGLKDYPLNVGVGYQRGAKIQGVEEAEKRILLFIAFDMPLFTFY